MSILNLGLNVVNDLILTLINLAVDFFGRVIIGIAASLVNYVFNFQSFIKMPVVQIGWTLSRDLANMAFILVMLAMAFGTILRLESYGWKKLLPRLIGIAILINFSLIIGGVFIDIGNSVGKFFISGGQQDTTLQTGVGDFIMTAMRAGNWAQLRNEVNASAVTTVIMASVVQLIFYLIIAFLLLALGLLMIFRMINLWLLLILAPLAWAAYFIPGFSGYWSNWWNKFFKWALFPAVMGFFIFLGLLAGATLQATNFGNVPDPGGFWSYIFPETAISAIMQFIVVVGILMIGLSQATAMSGQGAESAVKFINSAQKWGTGKLKGAGKTALGTGALATKIGADKLLARSQMLSRAGLGSLGQIQERMERVPGVGRAIGGPGARFAAQQKSIKDAEGKLKNLRPQDLDAVLKQAALTPDGLVRRAAAVSVLAEKGKLKNEHKQYVQTFANAGGNMNDLLQKMPTWAIADENIQNILAKNPATAKDWSGVITLPSDSQERKDKAVQVLKDKVFSKSADYQKIQKDAVDAKGSMTDSEYDAYKTAQQANEREKSNNRAEIESAFDRAETEIRSVRSDNRISAEEKETEIKSIRDQLKELVTTAEQRIIELEESQLVRENEAQYLFRKLMKEEMGENGKVQVSALNALASDSPAVYLEFKNYLRNHAAALKARGEIKDNIYKHLVAGPIANITGGETTT